MSQIPLVALVGRPNVGKSTLFNRVVGQRLAVVDDRPGTTRDRQYAEAEWQGALFTLVDTGGIEMLDRVTGGGIDALAEDSALFLTEIRDQAELAIADADVIIFVVDLLTGITAADEEVVQILRRSDKPVIVAASKGDNPARRAEALEFYGLGIGDEVFPVSGMHGSGVGDLLDAVVEALPYRVSEDFEDEDERLKIAIVGRPNVGKSTLINRLLGEERVIASPVAGTTRDAIDLPITWHEREMILIDTAGIRRRGKIVPGVEKYSVLRALKAIRRANLILLLIDATEPATSQDSHIAGMALEEMKSVIVLVNKWDAVEKDSFSMYAYSEKVREALKFMPYVPILFISALEGQRVGQIFPAALEAHEQRFLRVSTAEVNRIVQDAIAKQQPPSKGGRRLKIRYASQVAIDPPKFLFHVNDLKLLHFSYERYLENRIREVYPFKGTPIQMSFRRSSEDRGKR